MDEIRNNVATRQCVNSRKMPSALSKVTINIIRESLGTGLGYDGDVVDALVAGSLKEKAKGVIDEITNITKRWCCLKGWPG